MHVTAVFIYVLEAMREQEILLTIIVLCNFIFTTLSIA